jgi:hypothetical protein
MVFVTICCANYIPKARVLGESVKRTHAGATVVLCLVERSTSNGNLHHSAFDRVVLASELGIPDFDHFVFRHTMLEAATAIKAQLLLWLLKEYPKDDRFIYLDPDIWVVSSFDELDSAFARGEVILTPHHISDDTTTEGIRDNVLRTLACGAFNLGFLGIRRGSLAQRFLEWWNAKLQLMCYVDFAAGLFVDQKWVDLAVSMFELVVLREPGYNVANWNISNRVLSRTPGGRYLVNDQPLRFVHFSKIDSGRDLYYFRKYVRDASNPIFELRTMYRHALDRRGQRDVGRERWSYDYFESGERIMLEARIAFRNNRTLRDRLRRPFSESNEGLLAFVDEPRR